MILSQSKVALWAIVYFPEFSRTFDMNRFCLDTYLVLYPCTWVQAALSFKSWLLFRQLNCQIISTVSRCRTGIVIKISTRSSCLSKPDRDLNTAIEFRVENMADWLEVKDLHPFPLSEQITREMIRVFKNAFASAFQKNDHLSMCSA